MRFPLFIVVSLLCSCSIDSSQQVGKLPPNYSIIEDFMYDAFQESCDTAVILYTKIISMDTNNAEAYWRRGMEYYRMKLYENALADMNKSLQVDSSFSYDQVISTKGQTRYMLKDYKNALMDFTTAINFALTKDTTIPQSLEQYYYDRASTKLKLGDTTSALTDLDSAIHFWDSFHFAIKRRAEVNTALGNYTLAMKDYKLLMKQSGEFPIDEEYSADFYYRGIAKQKTGDRTYIRDLRIAKKFKYYKGKTIYIKGLIDCG